MVVPDMQLLPFLRRVSLGCIAALLLSPSGVHCQGPDPTALNLHLTSGGYDNYLWRSNITAAQLLLTSPNVTDRPQRFVVAMPAGNSGALSYFLPVNSNNQLSVQLVPGSLRDATGAYNNVGVQGELSFTADATLGVAILGAVRAMRDYVEGSGTMHEIFNYTLAAATSSYLHLHRPWINSTRSLDLILSAQQNMVFNVAPFPSGSPGAPSVVFQLPDPTSPGILTWKVLCNETTVPGLDTSGLFLDESQAANEAAAKALRGLANGTNVNAQELSFLAYQSKSLAGGWRFLTYFGRDTLIALRLLMPLFTPEASESVLGAVLERLNSTGAACHEETIGDYASFINLANKMPSLGDMPFYDYKMIDTDLYILPTVAHYLLDIPQGRNRAQAFLSRTSMLDNPNIGVSYHDLLARNAAYILGRAKAFALHPSASNLLHLRPGQPVGNWRDSNQGLGYGQVPFDVNAALVPAALRALERLSQAGILVFNNDPNVGTVAGQYAEVWERNAAELFNVEVQEDVAESRLKDFVMRANLSDSLLPGVGTSDDGKVTFYAVSLDENGMPVDVMHSDLGFSLLFAPNVDRPVLQRVVELLQPYPKGLLTNVGMLTANPALSKNRTQIDVLNRAAYHGTVVWSFQQALMAAGLARQLKFCDESMASIDIEPAPPVKPSWCSDKSFVSSVMAAQTRLWESINGGRSQIYSEVWSYSFDRATNQFDVADIAVLSPQGTESDAIQFWSFTFLAVADPTSMTK